MEFGLVEGRELAPDAVSAFDHVWQKLGGRQWVVVSDRKGVETVAESGLGVIADPFGTPENARDWVELYERVLTSDRCVPEEDFVNAKFGVRMPVEPGFDPGEVVGLVERYREVGVDLIVFELPEEGGADAALAIAQSVIPEFDDEEVREQARAKAERLAPVIEAALERKNSAPPEPPRKRSLSARAAKAGPRFVQKLSDRQIELLIGNRVGVRGLFHSMARMYRPSRSGGFRGDIEYTLDTPHGPEIWTITCGEKRAVARRGKSEDAGLHVSAGLADFLRVGTGDLSAPAALMSGRLEVRGDFQLAVRMGEMFGGAKLL